VAINDNHGQKSPLAVDYSVIFCFMQTCFTALRCRKCKNNAGTFDVLFDLLNLDELLVRIYLIIN